MFVQLQSEDSYTWMQEWLSKAQSSNTELKQWLNLPLDVTTFCAVAASSVRRSVMTLHT